MSAIWLSRKKRRLHGDAILHCPVHCLHSLCSCALGKFFEAFYSSGRLFQLLPIIEQLELKNLNRTVIL